MSRSSRCCLPVLRVAPYRSRRIATSHRVPQPAPLFLPATLHSASLALLFLQPCLQTPSNRNRLTSRCSESLPAPKVTFYDQKISPHFSLAFGSDTLILYSLGGNTRNKMRTLIPVLCILAVVSGGLAAADSV